MVDASHTLQDAPQDRRPGLIICAWDPAERAWDPVEDLSGTPWSPPGARTIAVDAPAPGTSPEVLARTLTDLLAERDSRALLLVGRGKGDDGFRLQMRAENRRPDGDRLIATGPSVVRATAPVADIIKALTEARLDARASSEDDDDTGSIVLYRILAALPVDADVPAVGLLRLPARASTVVVQRGVKAAASAIAQHLSPLPRLRVA